VRTATITPPSAKTPRFRLPDGSRSTQSPWVWRGFFFMSLIALGLCIAFATAGQYFFAGAWGVITAGWFAISMWLWRRNVLFDRADYAATRRPVPAARKPVPAPRKPPGAARRKPRR
jgi:hypothetical protein